MTYYFSLQFKMLNRHLSEFGLHPIIGYILAVIAFLGFSFFLFFKTEYAAYIYAFMALNFLGFNNADRNYFLKSCFSKPNYIKVRLLENLIVAFPFIGFLCFKHCFLVALALLVAACIAALFNFGNKWNFTFPTPFYKYPFEFTVGFRKTFLIFLFAYFLAFMAVYVGNFNLGIFSLVPVFFTCMYFYSEPEPPYYVWIFALSPKQFLISKCKTALLFSTILCLPIMVQLAFFFSENIPILLGFLALGYVYLLTFILAKYSAFPKKMSLPQAILLSFGMGFPPFLLGVIPFFYSQSIKKLNQILE